MAEPPTTPPARRQAFWLWALAAIVLIGIGVLIAVRAFGDDDSSGSPTDTVNSPRLTGTDAAPTAPGITESTPETTPGGPKPDPPPSGKTGRGDTLLVNGKDLYPFLGGNLLRVANAQVEGKSVPLIEVASDKSFWVGRSKAQRLLIVLNLKGGAPPKVAPGQKVQFVGQIVDIGGGDHGVTDDEDLQLLRRQDHYASVSAFDLKVP